MPSYMLWCWDRPRRSDGQEPDQGATNALRFATQEEAELYGRELYSRWMGLDHYEVRESTDPVNYRFDRDQNRAVEIPISVELTEHYQRLPCGCPIDSGCTGHHGG